MKNSTCQENACELFLPLQGQCTEYWSQGNKMVLLQTGIKLDIYVYLIGQNWSNFGFTGFMIYLPKKSQIINDKFHKYLLEDWKLMEKQCWRRSLCLKRTLEPFPEHEFFFLNKSIKTCMNMSASEIFDKKERKKCNVLKKHFQVLFQKALRFLIKIPT